MDSYYVQNISPLTSIGEVAVERLLLYQTTCSVKLSVPARQFGRSNSPQFHKNLHISPIMQFESYVPLVQNNIENKIFSKYPIFTGQVLAKCTVVMFNCMVTQHTST